MTQKVTVIYFFGKQITNTFIIIIIIIFQFNEVFHTNTYRKIKLYYK